MTVTNWMRGQTLVADDLDAAFGDCIDRRGDVMTGLLTLGQDPVSPMDAVPKHIVDAFIVGTGFVPVAGGTMTGLLTLNAGVSMSGQTATGFGTTIGNILPPLTNVSSFPALNLGTTSLIWPTSTVFTGVPPTLSDGDTSLSITNQYLAFNKRINSVGNGFATLAVNMNFNNPSAGSTQPAALNVTATAQANIGGAGVIAVNGVAVNGSNGSGTSYGGFFTNRKTGTSTSFGLAVVMDDRTGLPSSTGKNAVNEIDCYANDLDDVVGGGRTILTLAYGKSTTNQIAGPMTIHTGILIGPTSSQVGTNVSMDRVFSLTGAYNTAVFDLRNGQEGTGAHALWLASGQTIALDTAGTRTVTYDSGSGKIFIAVSGTNRLSIDASGNVRASGTITPSVTP